MGAKNSTESRSAPPDCPNQGSYPGGEQKLSNQNSLPTGELTRSHHSSNQKGESTRSNASPSPDNIDYADVPNGDGEGDGEPDVDPMDLIPIVARRDFISQESHRVVSKAAVTGIKAYKGMLEEGKITIYKQKMTGMDMQTLERLLNTIKQDWNLDTNTFPEFIQLTDNIISGEWKQDKEKIEMSADKSQCLFYNLQYDKSNGKFRLALCHIRTDSTLNDSVVAGGLLSECLLAKDEKKNLYLQF